MLKRFLLVVIGVAVVLSGFVAAFSAEEDLQEVKIKTSAYSFMCKNRIETELKNINGIEDSFLNLDDKIVTIKYNSKSINPDEMKKNIEDLGYEAEIMKNSTQSEVKADKNTR
ncbi:MAG: heavy-metal-associated domain-containing protein [Desulfobulbaceae bacterium]|nr:heavy-metal-associated domain-containing protein [Desulfobulbaceae bacterium]